MVDLATHFAALVAARFGLKKIKQKLEENLLLPSSVYHSRTIRAVDEGNFSEALHNLKITLSKDPDHSGAKIYQKLLASNVERKLKSCLESVEKADRSLHENYQERMQNLTQKKKFFWMGYFLLMIFLGLVVISIFFYHNYFLIGFTFTFGIGWIFFYRYVKQKINIIVLKLEKADRDIQKLDNELDICNQKLKALYQQYHEIITSGTESNKV